MTSVALIPAQKLLGMLSGFAVGAQHFSQAAPRKLLSISRSGTALRLGKLPSKQERRRTNLPLFARIGML